MSGFKINKQNIEIQYFGTSNTLKLTIESEESNESGVKETYTNYIWIEPHTNELENLINALQEAKKLL